MRLSMHETWGGLAPRLAGAVWAATLVATPAQAFYQDTTLEGTIGTDISGVWLFVADLAAEFRVRVDRESGDLTVPVEVEPTGGRYDRLMGKDGAGVVVTKVLDQKLASGGGLLPGDVIVSVNGQPVSDPAGLKAAAQNPSRLVLLQVRRPGLQQSKAALWKIDYQLEEAPVGEDGAGGEKIKVEMLDLELPFAKELEESRRQRVLWEHKENDLAALRQGWFELPPSDPFLFVGGNHRVVAASSYDAALHGDSNLAGTGFAMISDMKPNPIVGGTGKSIWVYGFQSVAADSIEGTLVEAAMASAPFPVAVEFKGRFRAFRIDEYSNKDVEHRLSTEKQAVEEDLDSFELEPDIPADLK